MLWACVCYWIFAFNFSGNAVVISAVAIANAMSVLSFAGIFVLWGQAKEYQKITNEQQN